MSIVTDAAAYVRANTARTARALTLFEGWCDPVGPHSNMMRMGHRLACNGGDVERAAAREYLMGWDLAIGRPRAFRAPHTLGM